MGVSVQYYIVGLALSGSCFTDKIRNVQQFQTMDKRTISIGINVQGSGFPAFAINVIVVCPTTIAIYVCCEEKLG